MSPRGAAPAEGTKKEMSRLTAALEEQVAESARPEEEIREGLRSVGYGD